ncbi:MAG: DUF2207 domain-containing protein [Micromonosporaceae bacterium]
MSPALIDTAIAVASLSIWIVAYVVVLVSTRPERVEPGPATPDLGEEPPAVVNLLANRWRLTEDAAEATLLDLAARGWLELRQPGNDPRETSVHLRERDGEGELTPYERRVLNRVKSLAVDGMVPVTALTFREPRQARRWQHALRQEVIADARARGLSRRRASASVMGTLTAIAAISAAGVGLAVFRTALRSEDTDLAAGFWVGAFVFLLLVGIAARSLGERDTPAGREAAARWLGVRAWLRGHEEFAKLPPAAVAVWDRYLPYGAALGVTGTASEVLDFGLADRRRVWSAYGGRWRRVRIRYPKLWARYGQSAPQLLVRAAASIVVGAILLNVFGLPRAELPWRVPRDPVEAGNAFEWLASAVATVLLVYGAYLAVRTVVDLMTVRTITGEVLWVARWRSRTRGSDRHRRTVTWLYYLAVDDGTSDRTVAWGLPAGPIRRPEPHDVVRIRVRPWTRRVVELTVVTPARPVADAEPPKVDSAPQSVTESFGGMLQGAIDSLASTLGAPVSGTVPAGTAPSPTDPPRADTVLTAEEVSEALGVTVGPPARMALPGLPASATFATADGGRAVLAVGLLTGRLGEMALRRAAGGTAVPGIGEAAYVRDNQAAVRCGDAIVTLTLMGPARQRRDRLPWLLERAASRLPRQREPA